MKGYRQFVTSCQSSLFLMMTRKNDARKSILKCTCRMIAKENIQFKQMKGKKKQYHKSLNLFLYAKCLKKLPWMKVKLNQREN